MVSMGEPARLDLQAGAEAERMLGVTWDPERDSFKFKVVINLSILRNKSCIGPNLTKEDLMTNPPLSITRRQYYSQVQSLFDPIGLLSPVLLRSKILLKKRGRALVLTLSGMTLCQRISCKKWYHSLLNSSTLRISNFLGNSGLKVKSQATRI